MKEIREAYCSYELSKRLKEEGFNEPCHGFFYEGKPSFLYADGLSMSNSDWNEEISAPTHQMAMAWLRNEHEEHICAHPVDIINEKQTFGWIFEIYDSKIGLQFFQSPERFGTYEEAVEAALEHCLDIIDKTR